MLNHARQRFEALYRARNLANETDEEARRMMSTAWNGHDYDDESMSDGYYYFLALYAGGE